jgi:hypothetical protein
MCQECQDRCNEKLLGSLYIPCVKGVLGKFKRIRNRNNIGMIFRTKHTVRSLVNTRQERDPKQTAQCVCSIPCDCGGSYIGETADL